MREMDGVFPGERDLAQQTAIAWLIGVVRVGGFALGGRGNRGHVPPMLELVTRSNVAAIVTRNALPAGSPLAVVPIEGPTPVRTPGLLWPRNRDPEPPMRSFAGIVRRTALHESLRRGES